MSDNEICEYCGGKIIDYGFERECENADFSPLGKKGTCTRPKIQFKRVIDELSVNEILSYADRCEKHKHAKVIRKMVKDLTSA